MDLHLRVIQFYGQKFGGGIYKGKGLEGGIHKGKGNKDKLS